MEGCAGGLSVTVAEADFVESATLVAFTITACIEGIEAGAVYRPAEVIAPADGGLMVQATPVLLFPATVAVNCCVSPEGIEGFAGVTEIEISPLALPAPIAGETVTGAGVNVLCANAHEPGMSRESKRTVPPRNRFVPYFAGPEL